MIEGYKTCIIDTCYISNVLKRQDSKGKDFIESIYYKKYMPCYSMFTIGELLEKKYLYDKFIEILYIAPAYILKPHNELLKDEVSFYFMNGDKINSVLFTIPPLKDNSYLSGIKTIFEIVKERICFTPELEDELLLKWGRSHVANSNDKQSIETALQVAIATQLQEIETSLKTPENVSKFIDDRNSFLSVRMMELMVHYYFNYSNRKVKRSDVVDIATSANLPYMDAIITEKFKSEAIRQIKNKFNYLTDLEIINL